MCSFEYSPKYIALAQLHRLLSTNHTKFGTSTTNDSCYTIKFLNNLEKYSLGFDYAVPSDAPAAQHTPKLIGCTVLHFAIETLNNKQLVDYFIRHGAKITAVNELSYTPLRLSIKYNENWPVRQILNKEGLDLLLNGQYNQNDASNPSCKEGISHLHIACTVDNARMVEYLLRFGASADAAISKNAQKMAGFRPLHVAVYYRSVDSLKVLLKSGADLYAHEARGLTPLQLLVEANLKMADVITEKSDGCGELEAYYLANDEMAKSMLEHCADNFCDEYGFDRLHVAASMRDNTKLVDLLKSNPGINVNAAILTSSPQCPGYTPLHFAAICGFNAVKLLVEKGANLLIADAQGTTPFDICATKYEPKVLYEIMQLDETLKSIKFKASPLATLSEAIVALQNKWRMDKFLRKMNHIDDRVPFDSPLWPGYTLLHLVVAVGYQKYDFEYKKQMRKEFFAKDCWSKELELAIFRRKNRMLKYLIKIGANPLAQDVRNSSPVHLAFRRRNTNAVTLLLKQLVKKFKHFDNVTDLDGLSLLHISVAGNFKDVAVSLLQNNADVNFCTISEIKLERNNEEYYCFSPKSTPLHFAATNIDSNIISLLIEKGADPLILDADGFTPVLRMFIEEVYPYSMRDYTDRKEQIVLREMIKLLSQLSALKDSAMGIAGLSLLHVACWTDCTTVVKEILNNGADVNAKIISCDFNDSSMKCASWKHRLKVLIEKYAGYTPLHFAVEFKSYEAIEVLVDSGADLHARDARGLSPLHMALMIQSEHSRNELLQRLLANVEKFNCKPIDDYGITLLHVACGCMDLDWTSQLLLGGSDVNAQVAMHSPVWPGDTPLHIFTNRSDFDIDSDDEDTLEMAELLITRGADLILFNAEKDTPLHILNRSNFSRDIASELYNICLKNKLKSYVNRINKEGLSLLHIACQANNITMVTELLSHGADVNQPVDYFVRHIGGNRPLHFAIMTGSPEMLELLIKEGADLSAKDTQGWTVFHYFCKYVESYSYFASMIPTFCKHGLHINERDQNEISPLQFLLRKYVEANKFFSAETTYNIYKTYKKKAVVLLKCGARLNRPDFSMIYLVHATIKGLSVDVLRNANDTDILAVMDDGSTAIHNAVYREDFLYIYPDEIVDSGIVEQLVKRGCSLNAQDNRGRTALHVGLECKNIQGVYELLEAGIDPNIVDDDGKNYWVTDRVKRDINNILVNYLHKFTLLGLEMSESNHQRYLALKRFASFFIDTDIELKLITELKEPIGGFLLREILSEHILSKYAATSRAKREDILHKLASPELRERFPNFKGPIQYQYQRLLERMDLVKSAIDVLGIILGKSLPVLCLDLIISFLSNAELRILIRLRQSLQDNTANAIYV